MTKSQSVDVCIETGKKRVIASAVAWPGLSRGGKDEAEALQALLEKGPRYARVLKAAGIDFKPPASVDAFQVTERVQGNGSTDFGIPGISASADTRPVSAEEFERLQRILQAVWQAFDAAAAAYQGKELRKGPRGGGRALDGIVEHVLGAEEGYLKALGWQSPVKPEQDLDGFRKAVLEGMAASTRGETPAQGPRGGTRWPVRYYTRRSAWHLLDHLWEIEDRAVE